MATDLPRIRRLDEAVVNRIAAGEIIHRPANALKELLENSLDAGSTSISILAKDGGLKLLQIQDNGHGIAVPHFPLLYLRALVKKEDMSIVCERFTTSKLKTYDDLKDIATYGFRGEALASISHVAHLTITTKTKAEPCAYRAKYSDGKLVPLKPGDRAEPKACAGNDGTQITVEDLFFNVPTRRKALKNFTDEYNRIVDVVTRYAIHNTGVGFSCRKQGSSTPDVHTNSSNPKVDSVRHLYGAALAKELIPLEKENNSLAFKVVGLISNANYNVKKMTLLLFINNRAVESANIKRMLENVYASYLPKGTHPWAYLALQINPNNVDVNVHPTKREVHFLHEEAILEDLSNIIQQALTGANASRNFAAPALQKNPETLTQFKPAEKSTIPDTSLTQSKDVRRDHQLVRTDSKSQTLHAFFQPIKQRPPQEEKDEEAQMSVLCRDSDDEDVQQPHDQTNNSTQKLPQVHLENYNPPKENTNNTESNKNVPFVSDEQTVNLPRDILLTNVVREETVTTERVVVRLESILKLREAYQEQIHPELLKTFQNHSFVGIVDDSHALIQYQTQLILVNYQHLCREMNYQLVLENFHNFDVVALSHPASIHELVQIALHEEENRAEISHQIQNLLVEKSEMLKEYFAISITDMGDLVELPQLLRGQFPNLAMLPIFLLRLGTMINWDEEMSCFDGIANELAQLYAPCPPLSSYEDGRPVDLLEDASENARQYRWMIEHVIFPAMKKHLFPTTMVVEQKWILEVANLTELYKIFERC